MDIRTILVDQDGQDIRPLYADANGQINAISQKDLSERLIALLTKWGEGEYKRTWAVEYTHEEHVLIRELPGEAALLTLASLGVVPALQNIWEQLTWVATAGNIVQLEPGGLPCIDVLDGESLAWTMDNKGKEARSTPVRPKKLYPEGFWLSAEAQCLDKTKTVTETDITHMIASLLSGTLSRDTNIWMFLLNLAAPVINDVIACKSWTPTVLMHQQNSVQRWASKEQKSKLYAAPATWVHFVGDYASADEINFSAGVYYDKLVNGQAFGNVCNRPLHVVDVVDPELSLWSIAQDSLHLLLLQPWMANPVNKWHGPSYTKDDGGNPVYNEEEWKALCKNWDFNAYGLYIMQYQATAITNSRAVAVSRRVG